MLKDMILFLFNKPVMFLFFTKFTALMGHTYLKLKMTLQGAFAGLSLGVLSTVWVFIGKHIYGIPDKFLRRLNMKTTGCEFGNRSYTPATVFPATSSWGKYAMLVFLKESL